MEWHTLHTHQRQTRILTEASEMVHRRMPTERTGHGGLRTMADAPSIRANVRPHVSLLVEAYDWFTEGVETAYSQNASALLDARAGDPEPAWPWRCVCPARADALLLRL
jgi:hypothetical protein